MIGQLFSVVLDCPDPCALAQFYSQLLGLPLTRAEEGWAQIGDTHGSRLSFQRVPRYQPPRWPDPAFPPQVHLDLQVSDITEAEARVLRWVPRAAWHRARLPRLRRPSRAPLLPRMGNPAWIIRRCGHMCVSPAWHARLSDSLTSP